MKKLIFIIGFLSLFCNSYSQSGWFRVTTDSIPSYAIYSIQFTSQNTGYAVGEHFNYTLGDFYKTTNSGLNWQVNHFTNSAPDDLCFLNDNTGYITTQGVYYSLVYKTTNAGINWTRKDSISLSCFKIKFYDINTGIVAYKYSSARKTTDGGNTWTSLTGIDWHEPSSIWCFDADNWLVASNTNSLNKTTNGGINWIVMSGPECKSLYFINNTTGYTVAWNDVIFKTTNKGDNWFFLDTVSNSGFYYGNIFFTNENTGYVCANNVQRNICKTTDGGYNWTNQTINSQSFSANYIYFINPNTGFAGGLFGYIYKTTTGGSVFIRNISNEIPDKFSLKQNYPNPFNPSTVIKYYVPQRSPTGSPRRVGDDNVVLKIYDLLGKEVEILVNEKQSPGTYEVFWDASKFSSGVYYYRLITDGFSQTKKMLLIK
jgi:photosystem II stability/assembly factor-like uncharacterized protein